MNLVGQHTGLTISLKSKGNVVERICRMPIKIICHLSALHCVHTWIWRVSDRPLVLCGALLVQQVQSYFYFYLLWFSHKVL